MFVDSHCHLGFESLARDLEQVFDRCRQAKVTTMLSIATKPDDFDTVLAQASQSPLGLEIYCALGVHPLETHKAFLSAEHLVDWAKRERVVAIGETGLDNYYSRVHEAAQRRSFSAHLEAASTSKKPIIIHCRQAANPILDMIEDHQKNHNIEGVFHCFDGDSDLAKRVLDCGFYISFSGLVTFKPRQDLRAVARTIPLDRILIETDAPYLSPEPMRGRRNEPAHVIHTAAVVADSRGIDKMAIAAASRDNFYQLFFKNHPQQDGLKVL